MLYSLILCTVFNTVPGMSSFHTSLSNVCSNVFVTLEGSCVFFNSPEKNARGVLTVTEQQLG